MSHNRGIMAYAAPHRLTRVRDPHRLTTQRRRDNTGTFHLHKVPSFGKMLHVGVVGASSVGWAICQSDPSSEFIHMFQLRQTR